MSGAVTYSGRTVARAEGESVLDALLRAGEPIPHSCKAGACQGCMMQAVEGSPGPAAQAGLKPAYVAQNYFLACCARPQSDIVVRLPGAAENSADATILGRDMLAPGIAAIRLDVADDLSAYLPGQYITLSLPDGAPEGPVARSYSIANVPQQDGWIEIHVRLIPQGRMSGWLHAAPAGARLRLRGPAGHCVYTPGDAADFPMLLAGTGTGLAPLLGVLRDALRRGHRGPVRLFHGGLTPEELYQAGELRRLAAAHPNLECRFSVLQLGADDGDMLAGSIEGHVAAALQDLDKPQTRAWFCGAPAIVASLKKKTFLAGVPSRAIHTDPFLPSAA